MAATIHENPDVCSISAIGVVTATLAATGSPDGVVINGRELLFGALVSTGARDVVVMQGTVAFLTAASMAIQEARDIEQISETGGGSFAGLAVNTARNLGSWVNTDPQFTQSASGSNLQAIQMTDFSHIAIDAARNRVLFFGGGHGPSQETDIRVLNLGTLGWSSLYAATPASAMINNPANADPADGKWISSNQPLARHTYSMTCVRGNKFEMLMGRSMPFDLGDATVNWQLKWGGRTCRYDFTTQAWTYGTLHSGENDPGRVAPFVPWQDASGCVLDPVSNKIAVVGGDFSVGRVWLFDPDANTYQTGPAMSPAINATSACIAYYPPTDKFYIFWVPAAASAVRVWELTPNPTLATRFSSATIAELTMTGSLPVGDWATTAMFVYDSINQNIGGFAGNVFGSNPVGDFFTFAPTTRVWTQNTMQTEAGSAGPARGTQQCLTFDPNSGCYIFLQNDSGGVNLNTWVYRPPRVLGTLQPALGGSTYTNLDLDGDGYGVGPGALAPEADDSDPTVHTGAQALAKWGTLAAFLVHLGYNPARFWYLSPSGNNGTGTVNDITKPFLTFAGFSASVVPGDAIILRNNWNGTLDPPSGASGAPILIMSYPGELAVLDGATGSRFTLVDRSWITVDGIKTVGAACITGGTTDGNVVSQFHDNVFRHIETTGGGPQSLGGISAFNGLERILIEKCVFHDNFLSGGQHCIYLGSRGLPCYDVTIRKNLCYRAGYNGIHLNGRMFNTIVEDNVIHSTEISGISCQEGVINSFIRRNVIFNYTTAGIEISNYPGDCAQFGQGGTGEICPYDQTGNLIESNTFYSTDHEFDDGAAVTPRAILVRNYSVNKVGDLGHNTYRNNILVGFSSHYQPVVFWDDEKSYLATSIFDSNVYWNLDNSAQVFGFGLSLSFGFAGFTLAQAAALTTIVGSSVNADPLFRDASPNYWSTPTQFDLRLQTGSPALGKGAL